MSTLTETQEGTPKNPHGENPIYRHDCDACEFLGQYTYPSGKTYDLYFCPRCDAGTVLARYGDAGPDYVSGTRFAVMDIMEGRWLLPLSEALRRLWHAGKVKVKFADSDGRDLRMAEADRTVARLTDEVTLLMKENRDLVARVRALQEDSGVAQVAERLVALKRAVRVYTAARYDSLRNLLLEVDRAE